MQTMEPCPLGIICAAAARVQKKVPLGCTPSIRCQCSSVISVIGLERGSNTYSCATPVSVMALPPALLTRMSSGGPLEASPSKATRTAPESETSKQTAREAGLSARHSSATASAARASTSLTATTAPSLANNLAMAVPRPLPAPVTSAWRSSKRPVIADEPTEPGNGRAYIRSGSGRRGPSASSTCQRRLI